MAKQEKSAAELYREERKARIAKAAKKNQKKQNKIILTKKSKAAIAIVIVMAIALGIGGFAIGNSGILLRSKVAFTVGEENVSLAEYSYYYNSNYQEQYSYSAQFDQYYGAGMGALYTGYDSTKTPAAQTYTGEIEGIENPTWADYFAFNAKRQIQYAKAAKLYAEEKGIELDEEDYAEIEEAMDSMEETAKSGTQPYSLAAYLRLIYGKSMSVAAMKEIVTQQILVQKVSEITMDEYKAEYTDADIEKEYNKDLKAYGVVSLRNYEIAAEKYQVGDVVKGKVERIKEFGAFISIEPGIDGLVHVSEICHKWISNANEALKVGDEVEAKIVSFEKNKITLSIKALIEAPVEEVVEEVEGEEKAKASRTDRFNKRAAKAEDKGENKKARKEKVEDDEPHEYVSSTTGATMADLFKGLDLAKFADDAE